MKNKDTGMVRRIDDLGRVVIPKEIRRVFRIKEGDPLEIFVTENGILLKKYFSMNTIQEYAEEYSSSLHETTGHVIYITNTEHNISVKGMPKKSNLNDPIDCMTEKVIETKKENFTEDKIIVPVIVDGDCVGTIIIASKNDNAIGKLELKLAQTAAKFLGSMLENY